MATLFLTRNHLIMPALSFAILFSILPFHTTPLLTIEHADAHSTSTKSPNSFFSYLTDHQKTPALIDYSSSDFDPRHGKHFHLPSSLSIEEDLRQLRQVFDGLIVYSYHPAVTPIILKKAKQLHYRAVVLGI